MAKIPNIQGIKQALSLVQGLNSAEQQKILTQIALKDPALAELLKKHLVSIEDLQFLSPDMFNQLLKEFPPSQMALALRGLTPSVLEKILTHSSKWVKEEIQDLLMGPKQSKQEVQKAQDELMRVVRRLIAQGKIILIKDDKDQWV